MNLLDIKVSDSLYKIPYYATIPLSTINRSEKAIIVIHGTGRNALDYFKFMRDAAYRSDDHSTIIIAPHFTTIEDVKSYDLPDNTLYWSNHGWKEGNNSQGEGRISSFAAIEQLIIRLITVSPHLKKITITGHSAGGQFVNRFTAGNSIENDFKYIEFNYAPANPASYLYFSPHRALPGTENTFVIPAATDCPSYDDYKYGLQNLAKTGYMDRVGKENLTTRYAERKVTSMLGESDTSTSNNFDESPEAMFQGENRLKRGKIYFNYLGFRYGSDIYKNHQQILVPGVAHDASQMFMSDGVRKYLFKQ